MKHLAIFILANQLTYFQLREETVVKKRLMPLAIAKLLCTVWNSSTCLEMCAPHDRSTAPLVSGSTFQKHSPVPNGSVPFSISNGKGSTTVLTSPEWKKMFHKHKIDLKIQPKPRTILEILGALDVNKAYRDKDPGHT